jgi:FkbM family methyltransferase
MKPIAEHTLGRRMSWILGQYYRAPDHPMKLRIWHYLRRFMDYRRLTITYLNSGWITIDERDYIQDLILRTGHYEPEVWGSLAEVAKSNEVIWDVGANIGSFTIRALLDSRVDKVHAFEPDPLHAEILSYNVALNYGCYQIHQCALGNEIERKKLRHAVFPHGGGSTLAVNPTYTRFDGEFQIECLTVDQLIFDEHTEAPTLMKIDVEGWEYEVLKGATRLLARNPPKAIVFEGDSDEAGSIKNIEVVQLLENFGYSVSWIRRPEGDIFHRENYFARHKSIYL